MFSITLHFNCLYMSVILTIWSPPQSKDYILFILSPLGLAQYPVHSRCLLNIWRTNDLMSMQPHNESLIILRIEGESWRKPTLALFYLRNLGYFFDRNSDFYDCKKLSRMLSGNCHLRECIESYKMSNLHKRSSANV